MAKGKEKEPGQSIDQDQEPVDVQNDEYRGMGGSYVFDPATGKRTRIAGPGLEQSAAEFDLSETGGVTHESE